MKCKYCLIEFEAKRSTATFCSDSHRTLFGKLSEEKKTVKEEELKNANNTSIQSEENSGENRRIKQLMEEGLIQKASALPMVENKTETELFQLGKTVKDFCRQFETNPDDLFAWLMENYGQKEKPPNHAKGKEEKPSSSSWRNTYRFNKTGVR